MKDLGNKAVMARNMKRLMEEKGVTSKELSKKLHYPYTTILSWLKAENYPRIDKIEAMADYFGVLKSDLIEEKTEEEKTEEEEKPVNDDGLTEGQRKLIAFAKTVPEDKVEMILKVIQSIVESG